MSVEHLNRQIAQLARATDRLEAVLQQPKDEFMRDSAIQRFEFCFELSWKVLKSYLEEQGLEARSPRESIRGAFTTGLLPNDPDWLAMTELRNLSSHTYNEWLAERVYAELPACLGRFRDLLERLSAQGYGT